MNSVDTRKKIYNDRTFTEIWQFQNRLVYRHRALNSYPWTYKQGSSEDFTKEWFVKADRQLQNLAQEDINAFKIAKVVRS